MKTFNITTDTIVAENFAFAGNQKSVADHHNVVRVFNFRDLRGNANALPNYIKTEIKSSGFEAVCLGGTTYSHSVIGLKRVA